MANEDVEIAERVETPKRIQVLQFFVIPLGIVLALILVFIALNWLFPEPAINELLETLKSKSPARAGDAARELYMRVEQNPESPEIKKIVPELITIFKSENDNILLKRWLALLFISLKDERAVPVLIDAIEDSVIPNEVKLSCIQSLGKMGAKAASGVPVLIKQLDSNDSGIRKTAALNLGYLQDARAIEPLKAKLEDVAVDVQWNAALALAMFKNPACKNVVGEMLDRKYLSSKIKKEDEYLMEDAMLNAIKAVVVLDDRSFSQTLAILSRSDDSLKVREEAYKVLDNWRK